MNLSTMREALALKHAGRTPCALTRRDRMVLKTAPHPFGVLVQQVHPWAQERLEAHMTLLPLRTFSSAVEGAETEVSTLARMYSPG